MTTDSDFRVAELRLGPSIRSRRRRRHAAARHEPRLPERPVVPHLLLHGARRLQDRRRLEDRPLPEPLLPAVRLDRGLRLAAGPERLQPAGADGRHDDDRDRPEHDRLRRLQPLHDRPRPGRAQHRRELELLLRVRRSRQPGELPAPADLPLLGRPPLLASRPERRPARRSGLPEEPRSTDRGSFLFEASLHGRTGPGGRSAGPADSSPDLLAASPSHVSLDSAPEPPYRIGVVIHRSARSSP